MYMGYYVQDQHVSIYMGYKVQERHAPDVKKQNCVHGLIFSEIKVIGIRCSEIIYIYLDFDFDIRRV